MERNLSREPETRARALGVSVLRNPAVSLRALIAEILGYALVSAAALAIDAGLLQVLVVRARWHYLPASALSFIAGAAVAYVLSTRFVFQFRQVSNPALEFGFFLGIGLVGLLVNAAVLSVAISGAGLSLMEGKLVAAACTFSTNYVLRRKLLFSPTRTRR
jgi:putative flippase GtrA